MRENMALFKWMWQRAVHKDIQLKGFKIVVYNEDKYDSSSDEHGDRADITVPSYSDLNVLEEVEEGTEFENSSDEDYSKEDSDDDDEEKTSSHEVDYEGFSFLLQDVLRSTHKTNWQLSWVGSYLTVSIQSTYFQTESFWPTFEIQSMSKQFTVMQARLL